VITSIILNIPIGSNVDTNVEQSTVADNTAGRSRKWPIVHSLIHVITFSLILIC
jgi:hypothetical protein